MAPPESQQGNPENAPRAVPFSVLKRRAEFVAASRAPRIARPGFVVQVRNRHDDDPRIGVGFTCTKKVGNAVARNRAKRRLREIARAVIPQYGVAGHDYVLIGRRLETANRNYQVLLADLQSALHRFHVPRSDP